MMATRDQRGFGLLEMTIAMAVMGLLVGGAVSMLFRSQVTFELQQASADMRQQARVALDTITTELRLAGYRIDNVGEVIDLASINAIRFAGDIDDGDPGVPCGAAFEDATDGGAERITYELNGGQLLRSIDCWDGSSWTNESSQQPMARNLVGPQALFRYFDGDGNELVPAGTDLTAAQRAEVRLVALSLNLVDPSDPIEVGAPSNDFTITGRVRLPNVN